LVAMALLWNPAQTPDLFYLAQSYFGQLSAAETKLLGAVQTGTMAICGASANLADPSNAPTKSHEWGPTRSLRAALIRWLCIDPLARNKIGLSGIQVCGAQLIGELNLTYISVPFSINLVGCRLTENANLHSATLSELDLRATWVHSLTADCMNVTRRVFLSGGFRAEGEVRLADAQIGIDLVCEGGFFSNPAGVALNTEGIQVRGSISLRQGFHADGEVRMRGSNIGGNLDCDNGSFINKSSMALDADRMKVGGYIFFRNGFTAEGEVKLLNAEVGSNLECVNGKFKNPLQPSLPGSGRALNADSIKVRGYVFLCRGFSAEGQVNLLNADVGGDIECGKALFKGSPEHEAAASALCLDGTNVRGSLLLGEDFNAEGEVQASRAQIRGMLICDKARIKGTFIAQGTSVGGGLFWTRMVEPDQTELDLINSHMDALVDDAQSWPARGKLKIDGLTYDRFSSASTPKSARARLDWLSRQKVFAPQPYRQLARTSRNYGDDLGARRVLCEMERLRRKQEYAARNSLMRFSNSVWTWILRVTIGFGFHPARALWCLSALAIVGTILFSAGYDAGSLAPTEANAYAQFKATGTVPPYYEHFSPLIYSLENSLPILRFGLTDHWHPSLDPTWQYAGHRLTSRYVVWLLSPSSLRWIRWIQISLGWFFTTMGVAAVTGIVRKD